MSDRSKGGWNPKNGHFQLQVSPSNLFKDNVLPPGTNVDDRYQVIEPIGAGGMGAVYRSFDLKLNRVVALKVLSLADRDLAKVERAKMRLVREAQALARLSHPNVISVYDVGVFEDDVFIAVEFVDGNTLSEWMKSKHTVSEILEVMVEAGRGLAAAHKAGLVHRDFKPRNVIIGNDGRVRVLDFGLARAIAHETPQICIQDETIETVGDAMRLKSDQNCPPQAPGFRHGETAGNAFLFSKMSE